MKGGPFEARYYHLANQVPADATFATTAEARLARIETDILGGLHVDPSSGRKTFGNYSRRWLEARDVRPRTRDSYVSQLADILEVFENVELRKITPTARGYGTGGKPRRRSTPKSRPPDSEACQRSFL